MKGLFARWKERRAQRRKRKELALLARTMGTLDQMEQSGLLAWNARNRQMMIDSSLAYLMMDTPEKWTRFVRGLYVWTQNKRIWEAWDQYRISEELKAVREVTGKLPKGKTLTREDIDRIREARRLQLTEDDVQPPKVEPYELVIIAPTTEVSPDMKPTDPVGRIIAVGHYDPATDNIEMALWEEVKPLLKMKSEE